MPTHLAFLRAVNVGGTGKLPMRELRTICADLGFEDVHTVLQSGNVVLRSPLGARQVQAQLETALESHLGKPVGVLTRSPRQLDDILRGNPFPDAPGNRVIVFFLAGKAPPVGDIDIPGREEVVAAGREVFVHYPDGQARTKLKLPFADRATGRNLNTLLKLRAIL